MSVIEIDSSPPLVEPGDGQPLIQIVESPSPETDVMSFEYLIGLEPEVVQLDLGFGPRGATGLQGIPGTPGAVSGICLDFRSTGTLYFTFPRDLAITSRSALNGTGVDEAVISYAVDGSPVTLPFTLHGSEELAVTVDGMTIGHRVSFSLQ